VAFDIENTLKQVQSYVDSGGYFKSSQIGEPKNPPTQALHAAVFMGEVSQIMVFAGGETRERHTVTVRVYDNAFAEPAEDVELEMARAVNALVNDIVGDADLGATIMSVDVAGMHGAPLSVRWGHVDVGGTMFRIADITLPLIVDGNATVAA
jgi:hypothetical protein